MESDPALKELLRELSTLDHDGKMKVKLAPGGGSHADIDGDYVQVDPSIDELVSAEVSEVNALRLVCDIFSHEMEHILSSDLTSKQQISESYPEAPQVAGFIANVLEDEYVDSQRIRRKPGMARTRAYMLKLVMADDDIMPPMDVLETPQQFIAAFQQLAQGGYVKNPEALDDEVRAFLERVRPDIETVRTTHDPDDRMDIMHRVMRTLLEHAERTEAPEEDPLTERGDGPPEEDEDDETRKDSGAKQTRMSEEFADDMDETAEEQTELDPTKDDDDLPSDPVDMVDYDARDESGEDGDEDGAGDAGDDGEDGEDSESGSGDDGADDDESGEDGSGGAGGDEPGDESGPMSGVSDGDGDGDAAGEMSGEADGAGDDPASAPEGDPAEEPMEGAGKSGGEAEAWVRESDSAESRIAAKEDQRIEDLGPDELDAKYGTEEMDVERETSLDRKRHERYVAKKDSFDTKLEEKRRKRDEQIHSYRNRADELRSDCRDHVEDVVDEFRDMVSRDQPRPDIEGQRLNRRNIVRRAAGDLSEERVYEKYDTTVTGDRCVAVTADISGSMRGDIWELKMMMGTLGEATKEVGDTFVASVFTDNPAYHKKADEEGPDVITEEALDCRLVTGPDEEFDWRHVDTFGACNNEPTSAGMAFTKELMDMTTSTQDVMFVITDGRALITRDGRDRRGTDEPLKDIAEVKASLEDDDVEVIGIGLGGVSDSDMDESFGDDWIRASIHDLAEKVIGEYKSRVTME